MAAKDRGGLQYIIKVEDQFSAGLKRFRAQVKAAKAEIAGLQAAQTNLNAARSTTGRAAATADRQQLQRLRELSAGIKQQEGVERLRANILKQQRREASAAANEEIKLFRQKAEAAARANTATVRGARASAAATAQSATQTRLSALAFKKLGTEATVASGAVNRVSFTFRRLIGIFAVFAAARAAGQGFVGLIKGAVDLNSTIEDAQISLSSLFTTIGQVTDVQTGELLSGSKAFAAAQGEAARQTELIRVAALSTTATFQELLKAFQAGVGPGLEAGLNLDEIREVTTRVSQAAAALSIPQNQLIEEIRSLLRGTIQARTTIVASVLGITNEDIANAKKSGTLFEFLKLKLEGFKFAAVATSQSLTGLFARLRDGIGFASGGASIKFFDELKISVGDLASVFVQLERNSEGVVEKATPRPEAVSILTALFNSLANSLKAVGNNLRLLTFGDIGNVVAALGAGIEFLTNTLSAFVVGFIQGLSTVFAALNAVIAQFSGAGNLVDSVAAVAQFIGQWAAPILAAAVGMATLKAILFVMAPLANLVSIAFRGILLAAQGVLKLVALLPKAFIPAVAAIGLISIGFKKLFSEVLGFGLNFTEVFSILKLTIQQFLAEAQTRFAITFKSIANLVANLLAAPLIFFGDQLAGILDIALNTAAGLNAIGIVSDELAAKIETAGSKLESFLQTAKQGDVKLFDVDRDLDTLDAIEAKFQEKINAIAGDIARRNVDEEFKIDFGATDTEGVLAAIENIAREFGDAVGFVDLDFDKLSADFAAGLIDAEGIAGELEKAIQAFLVSGRGVPPGDGSTPLEKYFQGIIENFETGLSIIRPLVSQFSSFISDSIVDAFDPSDDTDLLERFGNFLKQIAKLIIQELVQLAIAKAVLGLFGGAAAPGAGGAITGFLGRAEGGEIPGGHAVPRMARPKGLDPRDTTPIFAQPGEFMVKKSIVDQPMVKKFLKALNDGIIDPSALRSLIGDNRSRRHVAGMSSRGPRGYAEGGIIQRSAASIAGDTKQSRGPSAPAPAFLVANDQTMDKLLTGGGQAFRRYLSDNASEIDGILRRGRTGG